jgi:hypothetical protein
MASQKEEYVVDRMEFDMSRKNKKPSQTIIDTSHHSFSQTAGNNGN